YLPLVLPETVLGVVACLLFLGATWRGGRDLWGGAALIGLALAAVALVYTIYQVPTVEASRERLNQIDIALNPRNSENSLTAEQKESLGKERDALSAASSAAVYAAPVVNSRLALFLKALALAGAVGRVRAGG